jgi:ABC-type polar amino acid transport system ATPase subunit
MGVVFQQYNLFPHMTALENVCLGPVEAQRIARREAEERGRAVLERVGLAHRADAYPNQLSGGQQQRVAIARALAMQAEILLLDEPTSALDPELVAEVEDVVKGLREEAITMLLVTHSMAFARELADKVAFLAEGEIVEYGSADAVLGQPQDERLKEFVRRIR